MYKAKKIKSVVTPISPVSWDEIVKPFLKEEAKAVVWYYDKIEFYHWLDGKWKIEPRVNLDEEVVRIRVFNTCKEGHVWRSKGKLIGRLRVDVGEPEEDDNNEESDGKTLFVNANQIMNGTKFEINDNFLLATEDKGICYNLPFGELIKEYEAIDDKKKEDARLKLVTRNYIGYNDIGQSGYVDNRFESIEILSN